MQLNHRNFKTKFYIYDEVVIHNTIDDFWVVIHKNVLNLTKMLLDRQDSWNANLQYLLAFGGKDISKFFHPNGLPKTEISPSTGKSRVIFAPCLEKSESLFCHTPYSPVWSLDPMYHIGKLTKQDRKIRIINTLTGTTQNMTVCEEDTIYDIQEKYKKVYNHHAGSYIWRKDYKNGTVSGRLCLKHTLTKNGILFDQTGNVPPPALWLFYTDDYTIG